MELKDFLKLAGQQGKVILMGEDGSLKGVFLPADEYQKLLGEKPAEQQQESLAEKANREILQAQLEEVISSVDGGTAESQINSHTKVAEEDEALDLSPPAERIDSLLNKRAQELFRSVPNYNFVPPEVATSGDEEIKPNFDDI